MYSKLPPGAIILERGKLVYVGQVEGTVPAGFPSPAADFLVKALDLNDLLVTHPAATFLWRARGLSMVNLNIPDGALLVVNRALAPEHCSIVVAEVDGEVTVKQFWRRAGAIQLRTGNPTFPHILFRDGQTMTVCGVVTSAITIFR